MARGESQEKLHPQNYQTASTTQNNTVEGQSAPREQMEPLTANDRAIRDALYVQEPATSTRMSSVVVLPTSPSSQPSLTPTLGSSTPGVSMTTSSLLLTFRDRPYITREATLREYCRDWYQTPPTPQTQTVMATYRERPMIEEPFQNVGDLQSGPSTQQQSATNGKSYSTDGSEIKSGVPSSTGAYGCRTP
ncbi:hypothetical protein BKA67DRAFT_653889 [Truncatella angustata]|uniref:Uncharacterized protein n=1 Tax=Truncatella angustata TaxID=152316 RepID=A0A9P8UYX0_9PEZI|nr:uncharacterized protein BKA67DRAFT_653889 [Truncatella angustata]KAH6660727.1 hypothetical protein BKA67DRAFT_653889 [Truncatella angustata]